MKKRDAKADFKFSLDQSSGPPEKKAKTITEDRGGWSSDGVQLSEKQKNYLLPHFTMLLVGKPGSGKTSAIKTLLTNQDFYLHKFDTVLIMSPSANKMGIKVKKDNMNQEFNLRWIEAKLMDINRKQVQLIAAKLKELNIIDKYDTEKLNGQLYDSVRTDMSRKDAPTTI